MLNVCIMNCSDLGSEVTRSIRLLISLKNADASSPRALIISTAIGMKLYVVADKDAYFDFFWDSASQATVPGPETARFKWLTAKVSGHVKNQTRQRPDAHGAMINPSGLLLSVLSPVLLRTIPVGSNLDGISADANERLMRSLTAERRKYRPADFRQDKPCTPNSSVSSPQMHSCGAHTGAPRHSAIAILSDELSSLFPTEEQSTAVKKSPEWGAAAAISHLFDR